MRKSGRETDTAFSATKCTNPNQTGEAIMLNLSRDRQTVDHEPAHVAAPAASGADPAGQPQARRRSNLLWWLLVAVAIIL
jgi:hypothetical protein